jgi:hypothetical protein
MLKGVKWHDLTFPQRFEANKEISEFIKSGKIGL